MKILISPISLEEAAAIIEGGADIIDIKNIKEGSLGANFPWRIREVSDFVHKHGVVASATLGDLPYKPGTAALAAFGAASSGADYVKAGLYGMNTYQEAYDMMAGIAQAIRSVNPSLTVVASGYADYRRFGGLNLHDLVKAAKDTKCNVVMVDTAIKDGSTLFDALTMDELKEFVALGHEAGMEVALAGSVKFEHAEKVFETKADIVGVRGAVCEGKDRSTTISAKKTREFCDLFRKMEAELNGSLSKAVC
ncbi:MAG: (5-formylfuran-3-yl)methyl phosphate synthase [Candidatus Obscuribacterales bacterium]|nr:(5-formylfuran-3-yl)methyl phosphate synthase [Candidatus Obscuribacterales bacterium]